MATLYFRIKHTTYAVDMDTSDIAVPEQLLLASTAALRLMGGELHTLYAIDTSLKQYYADRLNEDIDRDLVVRTTIASLMSAVQGKEYLPINNDGVPFHKSKWRTVRQHFFVFNNRLFYYWGRLDHVHFTATWIGHLTEDGLVDLADYGEEYQSLAHCLYQSGDYEVLTSLRSLYTLHNGQPHQVGLAGDSLISTGMTSYNCHAIPESSHLHEYLIGILNNELSYHEPVRQNFLFGMLKTDLITIIKAADRLARNQQQRTMHISRPAKIHLDERNPESLHEVTVVSVPELDKGYAHYISLAKCPTPANQ